MTEWLSEEEKLEQIQIYIDRLEKVVEAARLLPFVFTDEYAWLQTSLVQLDKYEGYRGEKRRD